MKKRLIFRLHWGHRTIGRVRWVSFDDRRVWRNNKISLAALFLGLGLIAFTIIICERFNYFPLASFAVGMVMLVVATMLPFRSRAWERAERRRHRHHCPTCDYDLRAHHPGDKCPECGTLIPAGLFRKPIE